MAIDSSIGRILVAGTKSGLCFVEIDRDDAALVKTLRAEFPAATIEDKPSTALEPLALAAKAIAEAGPVPANLPLDIQGTAFQWRVWRALTEIPRGETRTYTDIANAIGKPNAVRAVAHACATNPISLVVPCHRVVGRDGTLRGYRWGLGVKRALIERERQR
jgi:AraC family transcriptional regulator of adaptative response/methylated-DNA-[protein]-cysteine methyltransferase